MNSLYSRQSFLGPDSEAMIADCRLGIIGLGGGGSHIVQQAAHLGIKHYVIYDPQDIEDTNLNRLVGATLADVGAPKTSVAERVIFGLHPSADIVTRTMRWQDDPEPYLRACDIIIGCVDGTQERLELEALARRYIIPLIDIGMDVHVIQPESPRMAGQIILSMPGGPCLKCFGAIPEDNVVQNAYGEAGGRPQVVWANGILASTAIGMLVDLITNWSQTLSSLPYLQYDGNAHTVLPHVRLSHMPPNSVCPHFPLGKVGPPIFRNIVQ